MKIKAKKTEAGKRTHEPFYEISQDAEGWHWLLWSGNGRELARNPKPYESKKLVLQAIQAVAGAASGAKAVVKGGGEVAVDATPAAE